MTDSAAATLIDWRTAKTVGEQVAGKGIPISPIEQRRLVEDFEDVVPEAERLVRSYTNLDPGPPATRGWVMSRGQWVEANLRGFERILEPLAQKFVAQRSDGMATALRRRVLAAQMGGLLGYLGHRVLGQYDVFRPADDDGLLYFVAPNVAGVEKKFGFETRDFRLWLALHEVTHRFQFGAAEWLRGYLLRLVDSYLDTVELDPGWLLQAARRAVADIVAGRRDHRSFGWVFLLMTPEQREMIRQMQALMSLLEGHANHVMDSVASDRIPDAALFRQTLQERRHRTGAEGAFQKAIGFDVKVRQYDIGERFVGEVVQTAGMDAFNRAWERPENLPTMDEVARPADWVGRVARR
ncbi:MAG TPA: zinc-dependent metalloprotease [Actinomycetota bacterium]